MYRNKIKLSALFVFCMLCIAAIAQPAVKFRAIDYDMEKEDKVDSFRKLSLMIAGNIYQNEEQIKMAYTEKTKRYDFSNQLRNVNPILNLGDIVIANLKTSFSNDNSSVFSAPDEFALSLKYTGINNMMLANSNTGFIDKKSLRRTKKQLAIFDINSTGAYEDNIQRRGNNPLIIERKGFRIAILNYSELLKKHSISNDFIINTIDKRFVEEDIYIAKQQKVDFTIVYFDWGGNYQEYPSSTQEGLGQFCLEKGADLVVGAFPNTVQRIDLIDHYYMGKARTGMVCYSLGNLITSANEDRTKMGVIMDIEILKNNYTDEVKMGEYGFIPIWNFYDTAAGKKQLYVIPVAAVEQHEIFNYMSESEARKMFTATLDTRRMLGRSSQEVQYNLSEIIINNVEEITKITSSPMNNRYNPFREEKLAVTAAPVDAKNQVEISKDTFYRIQFYELEKLVPIDTNYYDHLKGFEIMREGKVFRYLLGNTTSYADIRNLYLKVMKPRYKQCFIVLYQEGKRIGEIRNPQ